METRKKEIHLTASTDKEQMILDIVGTPVVLVTDVYGDDDEYTYMEFPNQSTDETDTLGTPWVLFLGDDSWGSLTGIWYTDKGEMRCEANFGDDGSCDFNPNTEHFCIMREPK